MRWPVKVYKVTGPSMEPTYRSGAFLLGSGWTTPKPGRVVVLDNGNEPRAANHIKRVISVDENGIWVEGDNDGYSTDSRHYGYIDPSAVKAVIVTRLTK